MSIVVANLGKSTWLSATDAPLKGPPVQIALRWRQARSPGPTHEQRMDLPHTLYPTDRVLIEAPTVPPDAIAPDRPLDRDDHAGRQRHAHPGRASGRRGRHSRAPVTRAIHSTTRAL